MGKMGTFTTVPALTTAVRDFCQKLNSQIEPVVIPTRVPPGALYNRCLGNVQTYVDRFGGKPFFGWSIWTDDLMIEGIPHVIWIKPSGRPLDITPHENGEERILFVPNTVQDEATMMAGEREIAPLVDHPLIAEYVELIKERDRLTVKFCGRSRDDQLLPRRIRRDLERRTEKVCEKVLKLRGQLIPALGEE